MSRTEADLTEFITLRTAEELEQIKILSDERLAHLRALDELRARFDEQAAAHGLTADAVINGTVKKKRRGRKPKNETPE